MGCENSFDWLSRGGLLPRAREAVQGLRWPLVVVVLSLLWMSPAVAQKLSGEAKDQLEFGVEMAERRLWSEALFRFERAQRLAPESSMILNNLAVAHEALGFFDQALDYYRKALALDPRNRDVKQNYARFVEFYQAFKPPDEDDEGDSEGSDSESGDSENGDSENREASPEEDGGVSDGRPPARQALARQS